VVAKIEGFGLGVGGGKPDEFAQLLRADSATYARIIKDGNIKISQ
jgi:hypothetical protein